MTARSFLGATGNDAGGPANEGQRKLSPLLGLPTRDAVPAYKRMPQSLGGEQLLLSRLFATLGHAFPRVLLTNYYISLKTNPLVVLTGPQGIGKAALVEGLARTLFGPHNTQFVTIAGNAWTRDSNHGHYYRDLHQQFGSFSFNETLQEAAAPENLGKVYLVLLKGLRPDELQGFFRNLFSVGPLGDKRLALPGVRPEEQPVLPPNVLITATLHVPRSGPYLADQILSEAGLIDVPAAPQAGAGGTAIVGPIAPPPVGFQRLILQQRVASPEAARTRLAAVLGRDAIERLGPSHELNWILQLEGLRLNRLQRDTMLSYVANSFDADGRGLFNPSDVYHNAQIAFDAQMIQRVLWQIPARNVDPLRWRLSTYLESGAGSW
jgi:hypothetical protein